MGYGILRPPPPPNGVSLEGDFRTAGMLKRIEKVKF